MSEQSIDLIYFDGCPNAEEARANLRAALAGQSWREWNLSATDTPEEFRRYGSPTVLVDGRDVTGETGTTGAMACRADGAPSQEVIREAVAPDV
ncbi:MAG: thioredoxin family protein [Gemmatimonadota bacterium]